MTMLGRRAAPHEWSSVPSEGHVIVAQLGGLAWRLAADVSRSTRYVHKNLEDLHGSGFFEQRRRK